MPLKEHTPFIENIPAYALGSLDAEDASALENHLKTCKLLPQRVDSLPCHERGLAGSNSAEVSACFPAPPIAVETSERPQVIASTAKMVMNQFALAFAVGVLVLLNAFSVFQMQSLQRQQGAVVVSAPI